MTINYDTTKLVIMNEVEEVLRRFLRRMVVC